MNNYWWISLEQYEKIAIIITLIIVIGIVCYITNLIYQDSKIPRFAENKVYEYVDLNDNKGYAYDCEIERHTFKKSELVCYIEGTSIIVKSYK